MHIEGAALDHPTQVVGPVHIPLLVVKNEIVVDIGHGEAVAHPLEKLFGFRGQIDGLGCRVRRGDFNGRQTAVGRQGRARLAFGSRFRRCRAGVGCLSTLIVRGCCGRWRRRLIRVLYHGCATGQ